MRRSQARVFRGLGALLLVQSVYSLVGTTACHAVVLLAGDEVVIEAGEVIADDVIAVGGVIRIDGVVQGDLVAAGGEIIVNGLVESNLIVAGAEITVRGSVGADVMAAGATLVIDGNIGDDIRIAGNALHLGEKANLGDDLFAAGFSLQARPGSQVNGSAFFAGYQALLSGRILENIEVIVGALEIRGTINGNVKADVGRADQERPPDVVSLIIEPSVEIPDVRAGLTIGESARIGGDLQYRSGDEAEIDSSAKITGEVSFTELERERQGFQLPPIRSHARRLVTLLAIGLVLLWVAPHWMERVSRILQERPLASLAWGAGVAASAAIVAAVIAILTTLAVVVLGALTLGGLTPPFLGVGLLLELALLTPLLIVALYLPPLLVGSVAGRFTLARYRPDWLRVTAAPLAVGLALYVLALALPLIGDAVFVGAALVGLGALAMWVRDLLSGEPTEAIER